MQHRYGRHGPRAWKRLQEWKYVRRRSVLPVPVVPTTMIVRIVVPTTTERVIVILMPEHPEPDEQQLPEDIQIITNQARVWPVDGTVPAPAPVQQLGEDSTQHDALLEHAKRTAFTSFMDIKKTIPTGAFVRINKSLLEKGIDRRFQRYFEGNITRRFDRSRYGPEEKQYMDAYLDCLKQELRSDPDVAQEYIEFLCSDIEIRLRDLAKQDRDLELGSDHLYNLAVARVVLELNIGQGQVFEMIETIQRGVDVYRKYYINPGEEVTWPDQDTFS